MEANATQPLVNVYVVQAIVETAVKQRAPLDIMEYTVGRLVTVAQTKDVILLLEPVIVPLENEEHCVHRTATEGGMLPTVNIFATVIMEQHVML